MTDIKHPLFEDRIIAFIDILGFKDIVKKKQISEEEILNILYYFRKNNTEYILDIKEPDLENNKPRQINLKPAIYSISDSLIISLPLTDIPPYTRESNYIFHINAVVQCIAAFYKQLLPHGISLRGAITVGKVHYNCNEHVIFGEPIIEAIEAESQLAVWPRIILAKSFMSHFSSLPIPNMNNIPQINEINMNLNGFRQDSDGLYHVRLFNSSDFLTWNKQDGSPIINQDAINKIHTMNQSICKRMEEHKDNLKIYSKWNWLLNYINFEIKESNDKLMRAAKNYYNKRNRVQSSKIPG